MKINKTPLMNENKWIDNPQKTIVEFVDTNPLDRKVRWIMITKTMVVIFFLPRAGGSLLGKRPKSASEKSSSCRF